MHRTTPLNVIALSWFIFLAGLASVSWGQTSVSGLFPAGGKQGTTVEVKLSGSFPQWPPSVQTIGGGLKWEYEKDKGKAKVSIAAEAAPGVRLLRWNDKKGASDWRAFVVGNLNEINEAEPNDSPKKPQIAAAPVVANGRLQKSGDVDTYSVKLKAGQTLVAAIDAKRLLDSKMDPVLQVCNEAGFVLAQNDDARGVDPLIAFQAPKDGNYLVRTFCFPEKPNSTIQYAGGADLVYRLTMTTGPMVDFAMPLTVTRGKPANLKLQGWNFGPATPQAKPVLSDEANEVSFLQPTWPKATGHAQVAVVESASVVASESASETEPQPVSLPVTVSGVIERARDEDTFVFDVAKRDRISVRVQAFDLGFPLDPILFVKTAEGKILKEADDQSRGKKDVATVVVAPADGKMHVQVRDVHHFGGPRYAYAVTIKKEQPGYTLTAAAQTLAIAPGKEAEFTINLSRLGGLKDEIQVSVEGLPKGVTAEPLKLDAKAKSGKLKFKVAADAKPFSGSLRLKGVAGDKQQDVTYTALGMRLSSVWLTVTEK